MFQNQAKAAILLFFLIFLPLTWAQSNGRPALPEAQRRWVIERDRLALQAFHRADYAEALRISEEVLARVADHPLTLRISKKARDRIRDAEAGSRPVREIAGSSSGHSKGAANR